MVAVGQWLESHDLGQYGALFEENRIEFDILPDLTEQDLEKLGIPLGDRKRLLKAIATISASAQGEAGGGTRPRAEAVVERREVTILFVDLSDYTRLTSTLGAEATHKLVQRFYQRVTGIVQSFSGTVERHIGDAIMAVFGVPVAHGNDPERALRAALAVQEVMPQLSEDVGHPLSVHAAIASGQVIASHAGAGSDFSTVGNAVNLGARLVGLARSGETVLSDAVHRAVAALCTAESVGEVSVKGFDQPVGVWRVLGLKQADVLKPRTPLIGRSVELRQFRALCEACRDDRTGHIVLVRGEAGIGKTRLVEEFETCAAAAGFLTHKGLTLDFGMSRTQDAIGRIVAGILGCSGNDNLPTRQQALANALALGLVAGDEAMFAGDILAVPLSAELHAVYEEMDNAARTRQRRQFVVRLLQRASERTPRLIVTEDLHWADEPLLDMLAEVAAGIQGHSVVLALTTRPDTDPLSPVWRSRVGPQVGMLTLDLRPLRESEALELAQSLAAGATTILSDCVHRSEGNPLFLEQLLRSALAGDQESLPGSVQSIVLSRLDRLPPRDRQAIQASSVLGQYFSMTVLRELVGDTGYTGAALVAGNLIRPMNGEFLFAHALIWEGTYASLLGEQKQRWHLSAAAWYTTRDPALAAEHFERAGDPRAARAYLDAARAENALQHTDRTIQLLERGVKLARDVPDRIDLLIALGELLPTVGRPLEALDAYERLLELAADDRQRCRAKIGIASGLRMLDRQAEALALLDEAQALAASTFDAELAQIHYLRGSLYFPIGNINGCLAEQKLALEHARVSGSIELQLRALSGQAEALALLDEAQALAASTFDAELAQIHYLRGSLYFPIGNINGCLTEQKLALEHARVSGSIELQLRALSGQADAHYADGRIVSAYEHFRECVEMSRKHHMGQIEAANLPMVAFAALLMGNLDEVDTTSQAALKVTQRMGNRRAEIVAHHGCAMAHLERGEVELARPHAQAAVDLSRAIGARRFEPESMVMVAACMLYEGDRIRATAMMREALARAREHISYCGGMILGAMARATDDPEERRRCLEEGEQILNAGATAHNHVFFYREAIEVALEAHDWPGVLHYADLLERQFRTEPFAFVDHVVARARALAAVGQGRREPPLRLQLQQLLDTARASRFALQIPALQAAMSIPGWDGPQPGSK